MTESGDAAEPPHQPRRGPQSAGELLDAAARCRLVSPLVTEILRAELLRHPEWSAGQFADHLVRQGRLTRWQADGLLAGRERFTFGRYRLVDRIGAGGMGVVLKAEQTHLKRTVALKILSRELLRSDEAVRRFHRELKAAAALDSPYIVRALDADTVLGVPYLVMEYVPGDPLSQVVEQHGRLPIPLACELVRHVCLGLQHAHECGLIHRDVKPGNVLLTRDASGRPLAKILDFGMARFTSENALADDLTRADQIFGTIDFIAPEQARSARGADIRADVFGAGCTLFYLITGHSPAPGRTEVEKLAARLENRFNDLSALRPDLPPALRAVIDRLLAVRPEDRYQTPAEAAAALQPFCGASPGDLPPPGSRGFATTGTTTRTDLSDSDLSDPDRNDSDRSDSVAKDSDRTDSDAALHRFLSELPPERRDGNAPRRSAALWLALLLALAVLVAVAVLTLWPR